MKSSFILLFVVCYVECGRKAYTPLDKNANLQFINMEGGGAAPPQKPPAPAPVPITKPVPTQPPAQKPPTQKPVTTQKPQTPTPPPVKPATPPVKPVQVPTPVTPKPVNPPPAKYPASTPGPGSVKQLVNFYDSQGKASPIRPYSYSQAVRQGNRA